MFNIKYFNKNSVCSRSSRESVFSFLQFRDIDRMLTKAERKCRNPPLLRPFLYKYSLLQHIFISTAIYINMMWRESALVFTVSQ